MEPNPALTAHLPGFATAPGQTDVLTVVVIVFLLVMILVVGNFYLRLHALPERMAHRANRIQMEIVAVLALISLFTHNHLFWIAALLLAFIEFPDISTPAASASHSLEKLGPIQLALERLASSAERQAIENQPSPIRNATSVNSNRSAIPAARRAECLTMLELFICSLVTIFPDYLYRRYAQGKRLGREINIYTVWYELRWGIVLCLLLTVSLITVIFYYHPSTKAATAVYRTVTILPEIGGRVAEVYVGPNDKVEAGQPLFRLDSSMQEAALETARRTVAEVEAATEVAQTELAAADGLIRQAQGAYRQRLDELQTREELQRRNPNTVAQREIERLQVAADAQEGAVDAAIANKATLQTKLSSLLPAQKASAEAARAQAQVELDKAVVRAGVTGSVQQFALRPGDVINPMLRPAGILVPAEAGRLGVFAGFNQIEAQVIKPGMYAEATCIGKPFTIIPMVVSQVQEVIASGQFRQTDQIVDVLQTARPGTITAGLEPLYPGGLDGVPPGGAALPTPTPTTMLSLKRATWVRVAGYSCTWSIQSASYTR